MECSVLRGSCKNQRMKTAGTKKEFDLVTGTGLCPSMVTRALVGSGYKGLLASLSFFFFFKILFMLFRERPC